MIMKNNHNKKDMKTKTLNQLWAHIERIRGYFSNPNAPGQAERLNRACDICNRYGNKAWQYLTTTPEYNRADFDGENTPVPMSVYAAK